MSVSWGTQYAKLKTNLRLAANRLKLLQKKKTEQAIKSRAEIAQFLTVDKEDRARIRVESIIREDFIVEAYELLEMYCELLLARFGIIQQMKDLDDGIAEAVSSLLWVAPRIGHEVSEFKVISDELTHKYGKQFAEAARMNQLPEPSRVSPKLVQKLSVSAPSKLLVEKYLVTIAQSAGVDFTPDPKIMRDDDDEIARAERNLINFMNEEQYGWSVKSDDGNSITGTGKGSTIFNANNNGKGNVNNGSDSNGMPKGMSANPYSSTGIPPPDYAAPPPPPSYQQPQQYVSNMYPSANVVAPYPTQQNFAHGTVQPSSEHIYETPPTIRAHPATIEKDDDFFLPKFPEPPKEFPTTYTGSGGVGSGTAPPQPPPSSNNDTDNKSSGGNEELDFDALARRFDELKKRL